MKQREQHVREHLRQEKDPREEGCGAKKSKVMEMKRQEGRSSRTQEAVVRVSLFPKGNVKPPKGFNQKKFI